MRVATRSKQRRVLEVNGRSYEVEIVEIPFREGIEAICVIEGQEIRVSDRQLGEHEALRLLAEEIAQWQATDPES